ncbi:MAG: GAF domain-containing protein, partial [Pseudoxanthomonas sp.]
MTQEGQAGAGIALIGGDVSPEAASAENRFARLVEHSPLSTQFFAPDGRVRSVNKAWERLFGITLADIADYNVLEDQQLIALGIMSLVQRGFAGETVQIPAIGYVPSSGIHAGQERWCSASIYPVLDTDGTVLEIVLSHHDLTDQHRVERELRESEERLRLGLEAGDTGTWDWMIPENRLTWSDRVYGFHGLSRDDFEPTLEKFATLIHPDDAQRVQAQIEASIRDQTPYIAEFRVVQPSGEIRWIATQGTVYYGPDGTPLRMLGATSDVTGRHLGEGLLAAQMRVLEMIATGAALDDTFIAIARKVEQQSSLSFCSICLLDPRSRRPQRSVAPSLPPALVEQLQMAALGEAAGPTGVAVRTGQQAVASELSDEPWSAHAQIVTPYGLHAAWSQPILDKEGHPVGAVTHYSRQARSPSESDLQLLSTAAQLAGIAVEREHAAEVEKTLFRVGQAMMEQTDVQPLVQAITDAGTELSHAEFGAFFYNTINADGERMMLYTLSGVGPESFAGFPMPRPTELFGMTFRGEGIVRSADITQDPRYGHNSPYQGLPEGHMPVRSYLAVPVRSRVGDVIGGLFFGHAATGIFGEEAEALITGLAVQAGLVLENASLLRQAQSSEAKFRQLADTIPQLAWMARPDGWIFWYNEQWHQYTGITSSELEGWGW